MTSTPRRDGASGTQGHVRIAVAFGLCVAVLAAPRAQAAELSEYGPRFGFSVDPDQFTIGAFADWGELGTRVHLRTSGDLGFGDNVLTFVLNGDVTYHFATSSSVEPYAGGGLGFAYYDFDIPKAPPGFDTTHNELGLNLVAGIQKDLGGYKSGSLELRLGIEDLPDFKVTAALGFL